MKNIELNYVKKIRKQLHITQQALSDLSFVARSTISDIENFKEIPSQLTMISISYALNRDTSEVFNLKPEVLEIYYKCRNTDIIQ